MFFFLKKVYIKTYISYNLKNIGGEKVLNKSDLVFLTFLRQNARHTLTRISRETKIPITTLYEKLKKHEKEIILKHTTLLDFSKLGYLCRANLLLRADRENRDKLGSYLKAHPVVNNLYKINNGYDFMAESVFENIKELEDFLESLDDKFSLEEKKVFYIIEDIRREGFLSKERLLPRMEV